MPAADVGWRLFVEEPVTDADTIYSDTGIRPYNDVKPDTWFDEESIEGYPFKVQSVTGGIPAPPREGLTGSLSSRRRLTGSLAQPRRLTGSLSRKVRLSGSLRSVRYGKKRR
jgi:hypothetical protein